MPLSIHLRRLRGPGRYPEILNGTLHKARVDMLEQIGLAVAETFDREDRSLRMFMTTIPARAMVKRCRKSRGAKPSVIEPGWPRAGPLTFTERARLELRIFWGRGATAPTWEEPVIFANQGSLRLGKRLNSRIC